MLFRNKPVFKDILCDSGGYRLGGSSIKPSQSLPLSLLEQLVKMKEDEKPKDKDKETNRFSL